MAPGERIKHPLLARWPAEQPAKAAAEASALAVNDPGIRKTP